MGEIINWVHVGLSLGALSLSSFSLLDRRNHAEQKELQRQLKELATRVNDAEVGLAAIPKRHEFDKKHDQWTTEMLRIHHRIDEINTGIKDSQLMLGELIGLSKGAKQHG
jgi:peptidoglycan hydrolase CwlO-like protein